MTNKSSTFCVLPWIHLATRPNGDVRVCCTANASGAGTTDEKEVGLVTKDGIRMNLREHSLEEIWNSDFMKTTRVQMLNNEIPKSCTKCFQEEAAGIVSKRQWETETWKNRLEIDQIVDQTTEDGVIPFNIPYFDLRLGNTCQLKCVMCSPHDSSSWIKEWTIQYPKYKSITLKTDQQWDRTYNYTWYQKNNFIDSVKSQSQNIKELYFAGGEPLLIPEHYKILEFMVESGAAKNCILRYNSNGLELPNNLIELWSKFKQVKFNFSIDALEEKNDYIRYPSKWSNVLENLKILDDTPDNITVNIACAVQALNVLYLDEFVKWKLESNFKKINVKDGAGLIGTHLVYLPSYLNVRILPSHIKELVSKRILSFIETLENNHRFITDPYGKTRWLGLLNYMNAEDWSHKLADLSEYIKVCDQQRNTDFAKTFPELECLLKS
jgi:MoaA/NifB/PqqE/SkfB family radical SAM enzyme